MYACVGYALNVKDETKSTGSWDWPDEISNDDK